MAAETSHEALETHVLNYFYDDDLGCALTVLANGVRFHIMVDYDRLQTPSTNDERIVEEYTRLLKAVRDQDDKKNDPEEYQRRKDLEAMEEQISEEDFAPLNDKDSGIGSSPAEDCSAESEQEQPVKVNSDEVKNSIKEAGFHDGVTELAESQSDTLDPETELQNWMLSCFSETFAELAQPSVSPKRQTVDDWFHTRTYFFSLTVEDGQLRPIREEPSSSLEQRMADLIPWIDIPKYIKELSIPYFHASDLVVLHTSDDPDPIHPCVVQHKATSKLYFLKLVDTSQPQPTKCELTLLKKCEKKNLHTHIRVPQVQGLVRYDNSKTYIMGFLQTPISNPTALTRLLDTSISQERRDKWAQESERMIQVLHDHGIIWGDAKADNFMVDASDDLWIIDFGGSYTEGWVEEKLMETEEGDNMGVDKVANALHDPENNTFEPSGGDGHVEKHEVGLESHGQQQKSDASRGKKRSLPDADQECDASDKENDSTRLSKKTRVGSKNLT